MKISSDQNSMKEIEWIKNSTARAIKIDSRLLKIIYNKKCHRCICKFELHNLRYKIVINMNPNARQNGVKIEFSERLVLTGNNGNDLNFILNMINKIDNELSFYKERITLDRLQTFIKDNAANLLSNPNNRKSMPYNLSIALAQRFRTEKQIEDEFRAKEIAIGLIILDEIRKMSASEIGLIK